jgi:hypothetical protein
MKNSTILIIVAVAVVAVVLFFVMRKPSAQAPGTTGQPTPQPTSGGGLFDFVGGLFSKNKGTTGTTNTASNDLPIAPDAAFLPGFDEGERLITNGYIWEKTNGQWVYIGQA